MNRSLIAKKNFPKYRFGGISYRGTESPGAMADTLGTANPYRPNGWETHDDKRVFVRFRRFRSLVLAHTPVCMV